MAIKINSNYENSAYVWLYLCYALAYKLLKYRYTGQYALRYGCQWIKGQVVEGTLLRRDWNERRERLEKALDCINKALECDSKYAGSAYIWKSKGEILHHLNRDDEAVKCYDKVLEINPTTRYAAESDVVIRFDGGTSVDWIINESDRWRQQQQQKEEEIQEQQREPKSHRNVLLVDIQKVLQHTAVFPPYTKCYNRMAEIIEVQKSMAVQVLQQFSEVNSSYYVIMDITMASPYYVIMGITMVWP